MAQHALGVVARRLGLDHRRLARGVEAGEQDAALHLRRGDRQRVLDRHHLVGADDGERHAAAVARLEAGAHAAERIDHPLHRPAAQRGVAGHEGGEAMARQDAGQERDSKRKQERLEIHREVGVVAQILADFVGNRRGDPTSDVQSHERAGRRSRHEQHHVLHQHLANHTVTRCAHREAHRHLFLALDRFRQHQVRNVRAHDQQQAHHRGEQDGHPAPQRSVVVARHRRHEHAPTCGDRPAGIRIVARRLLAQLIHAR